LDAPMITVIYNFIEAHKTISALAVYFIFSNFVSALPSPYNASSGFYKWFFAFCTSIGAALPRLFPSLRLPSDPTAGSKTFFAKPEEAPQTEAPKSS
jgi:hypothetical protein